MTTVLLIAGVGVGAYMLAKSSAPRTPLMALPTAVPGSQAVQTVDPATGLLKLQYASSLASAGAQGVSSILSTVLGFL